MPVCHVYESKTIYKCLCECHVIMCVSAIQRYLHLIMHKCFIYICSHNILLSSPWKFLGWGRANHFVATIWRCTTPPDYKMRCRPLLFCYKMAIENLPMILCCQFDFTNFATKWRWVRGTRPQYSFKKPLLQNDIWMMALHLHLPICIFRMPVCAKSICPPLATGEMASWSWKRS